VSTDSILLSIRGWTALEYCWVLNNQAGQYNTSQVLEFKGSGTGAGIVAAIWNNVPDNYDRMETVINMESWPQAFTIPLIML
jgi:hypothetical protein